MSKTYTEAERLRAVASVPRYPSIAAAARAVGIPAKTLQVWMKDPHYAGVLAESTEAWRQSQAAGDATGVVFDQETVGSIKARLRKAAIRNVDLIEQAQDRIQGAITKGDYNLTQPTIALGILMQRTLEMLSPSKGVGFSEDEPNRARDILAGMSTPELERLITSLSADTDTPPELP
jgi:transposase-like protein